jgi:hypothetical protein
MKKITTFTFFTIRFAHVVFPKPSNNKFRHEQRNHENKDLENDRLKG